MAFTSILTLALILNQHKVYAALTSFENSNCESLKVLNEQYFVTQVVIFNLWKEQPPEVNCIYKKYFDNYQVTVLDAKIKLNKSEENRYYNEMRKTNIAFAIFLPGPDIEELKMYSSFNLLRRIPKAITEVFLYNMTRSPENLELLKNFSNDVLFNLELIFFVGILLKPDLLYFTYDLADMNSDKLIDIVVTSKGVNYTNIVAKSSNLRQKFPLVISIFNRFPTSLLDIKNRTQKTMLLTANDFGGMDALMIEDIVQVLGFKAEYNIPPGVEPFGSVFENGTITGTLKQVADGSVDLSANPRFITSYGIEDEIVFLGYNHIDRVCLIIPKAELIPLWYQVVRTYTLRIWILILAQTVITALLRWLYYKMIMNHPKTLTQLFIETFLSYIAPIKSLQKSPQKLLLFSISLICIIIIPVIQGSVRSAFTRRKYFPDVNTLEDVDKNFKTLYAPAMDRKLIFEKGHNDVYDSLNEKMDTSPIFLSDLLKKILANKKSGVIAPLNDFKSTLVQHPPEFMEKFHVVQECPREYLYASICTVHFPWRNELSLWTLRLVASGLPSRYHEITMTQFSGRILISPKTETATTGKRLALKFLYGPFILYGIGVLLSILVFIVEVMYGRKKLKST